MKKILYIALSMLILVSCDQEEFTGTGLESLREFTLTPIAGSKVTLNSVEPAGEIVVSWSKARSGFESAVTYTWMLDEVGEDFSSPLLSLTSDENGAATMITFTNKQLDDALSSLGLAAGEVIEAQWTVSATNGDVTEVAEAAIISITRFVDALAPFSLTSPADNTALELDIDNPTTEVVISWEASFSGFGNSVTYQWLADVDGGDFSTPALTLNSDNSGAEAFLTFTHQELENVLSGLGVEEAGYKDIDWKVIATGGGLTLASTQVFNIQLRRFNPINTKFLVGAATPGGWGWDNPTEISEISEGVFQGTLMFTNEAFRVFDVRDDWGSGTNFPFYEGEGYSIDSRFENAGDGDNNFRFTGTSGVYTFTLDTNTKAIRLTTGASLWLVGAATPGGWSWDAPTELYQTSDGIWENSLIFTNDSFRVFEVKDDWGSGRNFPFYEGEGFAIDSKFENAGDGDSNFKFNGISGVFKMTLDNNNKKITLE